MAFSKLSNNNEALKDLNRAIDLNEDYVKAILKRGDIYMQ
jgi:hypothetical protein